MMNENTEDTFVIDISKCLDTKLLYEKDLPLFGYFLITIVLVLLISSVVWASQTKKPYVVKSSGVIEAANKKYIVNPYSGKIKKAYIKEGTKVTKGDVIFVMNSFEKGLQKGQLDIQRKELENSLPKYNKEIKKYEKLKAAIANRTNYFSDSGEDSYYFHVYETYCRQIKQETLTKKSLKDAGFKDAQITEELEKNKMYLAEIFHSKMAEIDGKINSLKMEINTITAQIKGIKSANDEFEIRAPNSGIVHLNYECKKGTTINAGENMASISDSSEEYYVNVKVSPKDRVKIKVGNKVEMEVDGMPQSIYGTISGVVISIDNDITISQLEKGGAMEYYSAKIKVKERELTNKSGEVFPIIKGMSVETRICYDKITYLDYVKEEIGFKAKTKQ